MSEPIIAADPVTNSSQPAAPSPAPAKNEVKQQLTNAAPAKKEGETGGKKVETQARTEQPVPKKETPAQPSMWLQMLPFILIFVVMIFFMNRSQKKQMQKRQEMMDKITKGTKVLLSSGIYGTVDAVQEDAMIVEIASGVKVKVAKAGVADVVTENGKVEGK